MILRKWCTLNQPTHTRLEDAQSLNLSQKLTTQTYFFTLLRYLVDMLLLPVCIAGFKRNWCAFVFAQTARAHYADTSTTRRRTWPPFRRPSDIIKEMFKIKMLFFI